MNILDSRKIVLTGGSGSIGREIFNLILKESNNCEIFVTGKNQTKLDKLVDEVKHENNKIYSKAFDLVEKSEVDSLIKLIRNQLDNVDILINCAGVFSPKEIKNIFDDEIEKTINLNFISAFRLSREFASEMVENKWGRIVNIGSSSAYFGFKNNTLYSATKHALLGFSKSLHDELKSKGVRVFCISPSSTKGEMGKNTPNQNYETFLDPDEVAKFILFVINFEKNLIVEDVLLKRMEIA